MNALPYQYQDYIEVRERLETGLLSQQEVYVLLTGETGTGKTALLRDLRQRLDRARYRICYFSEARKLSAASLVRILAKQLRVRPSLRHAESLDSLTRALNDEPQQLLLCLDEAQELPDETLSEVRSLAEYDLDGRRPLQVLFSGLPDLRSELQARAPLWRRIVVREELTGLRFDEIPAFLEHHFSAAEARRLHEEALRLIFEQARGAPGRILPMVRTVLQKLPGKGRIEAAALEEILHQWELA